MVVIYQAALTHKPPKITRKLSSYLLPYKYPVDIFQNARLMAGASLGLHIRLLVSLPMSLSARSLSIQTTCGQQAAKPPDALSVYICRGISTVFPEVFLVKLPICDGQFGWPILAAILIVPRHIFSICRWLAAKKTQNDHALRGVYVGINTCSTNFFCVDS